MPKEFAEYFKRKGFKIDDFVMLIPRDKHRLKSGVNALHVGKDNWNKQWEQWIFKFGKEATADDVLKKCIELMNRYDINYSKL